MYQVFAILILIASILLIGVVLIQKSKGGGLAANVNNYNQYMGVRKTTDFIEKATWGLAIFICVLSIASAFVTAPSMIQGKPQITSLPAAENKANQFGTPAADSKQEAAPAATAEQPAQAQSEAPAAAPAEQPAQPEAPAADAKK